MTRSPQATLTAPPGSQPPPRRSGVSDVALVAGGGAAAAFVALTLGVAAQAAPLAALDTTVSQAAYDVALRHPGWLAVMRRVTQGAEGAVVVPATLVLGWSLWRPGRWAAAWYLVATVVIATLVRLSVRAVVARPRPVTRLAPAVDWAFPSGHTTAAALTAVACVVVLGGLCTRAWQRWAVLIAALAWTGLIGLSRVALVVHWPTDVLGACFLVAAVSLLIGSRVRPWSGTRRSTL